MPSRRGAPLLKHAAQAAAALGWPTPGTLVECGGLEYLRFATRRRQLEADVLRASPALSALGLRAVCVDGGVGVFLSSVAPGAIAGALLQSALAWGCEAEALAAAVDAYCEVCDAEVVVAQSGALMLLGADRPDPAGRVRLRAAFSRLRFEFGPREVDDVLRTARRCSSLRLSWPRAAR